MTITIMPTGIRIIARENTVPMRIMDTTELQCIAMTLGAITAAIGRIRPNGLMFAPVVFGFIATKLFNAGLIADSA